MSFNFAAFEIYAPKIMYFNPVKSTKKSLFIGLGFILTAFSGCLSPPVPAAPAAEQASNRDPSSYAGSGRRQAEREENSS
jgi:hypothetical protein